MKDTKVLSDHEIRKLKAIAREVAPVFCNEAADAAARKVLFSAKEQKRADRKTIFRETEDLLRARETLEDRIEDNTIKLQDLENGIEHKTRATDIVFMAQNRISKEQLMEGKIIDLQSKIERDKAKLEELWGALEVIVDDTWYKLIELKYWQDLDDEQIGERLNCDPRTVRRHKNRLVWRMSVKIAGSEML
jgi:uncharacterized protein (DUF342 family)